LANRRSPKTVFPGGFALNSAQGPFFNATITGSTKTTVTIAGAAGFEGKVAMVRYGWDDMPSLFYDTQIAVCECSVHLV
jgi:hypothetical protein